MTPPRRRALLALLALLAGLGVTGLLVWPFRPAGPAPATSPDPRLTFPTRYRNVKPDVAYVGSERCAGCHGDIALSYAEHPMGRSLAPVASAEAVERFGADAHVDFEAAGFRYRVRRDGDALVHEERKLGPKGQEVYALTQRVAYVVGSGTRGRSYLVQRDGFLFQSPVSWFSEAGRWDLSPGYGESHRHFERPMTADCLFCHADRLVPAAGAVNRFEPPTFRGHAIGCERCHGPGELHAALHEAGGKPTAPDDTIVQPGRLEPRLRDAVCEQCHLQGEGRVLRLGREVFDYRPGLPLDAFLGVFVLRPELSDNRRSVGHFEQLAASVCAQRSGGRLGCISCHDPHTATPAAERAAWYRGRCLACHDQAHKGCALPPERRAAQADACTVCHMPRTGSSDIAHTSITDHRIPRRPDAGPATGPRPLRDEEVPIVEFHAGRWGPAADHGPRELGLMLSRLAEEHQVVPPAALALPSLDVALAAHPNDVEGRVARAVARQALDRREEALADVEAALAAAPRHERALFLAATLARELKKVPEAQAFCRRAIAVNPYASEYHYAKAYLHLRQEEWAGGAESARAALALNPARTDARRVLIHCLLRAGRRDEAAAELAAYRAFAPADLATVEGWFAAR